MANKAVDAKDAKTGTAAPAYAASAAGSAAAAPVSNKPLINILDQPLSKGTKQVSASSFAFLFSELVQYCQSRVDSTGDLEKRLAEAGYGIGLRVLEMLSQREKACRKERTCVAMLQFIHSTVWRALFGRAADDLKKSTDREDEYYLYEKESVVNRFVSVPKDLGSLNCAAFVAGIINGILDGAQFPAEVNAHFHHGFTVYIVKFAADTLKRDQMLAQTPAA